MMFLTPIFDSRACCAEQIVQTGKTVRLRQPIGKHDQRFLVFDPLIVGAVLHEQRDFIEDQQ